MVEECLYGELAISLNMPKEEVKYFIVQTVKKREAQPGTYNKEKDTL